MSEDEASLEFKPVAKLTEIEVGLDEPTISLVIRLFAHWAEVWHTRDRAIPAPNLASNSMPCR